MAFADTAKLVVDLSLSGNFQSGLSQSQRALNTFDSRLSRTQSRVSKGFSNLGKNLKGLVTGPLGLVGATSGVVALGLAFKGTIDAAVDWETAFKGVQKTVAGTPAQFEALNQGLRDMAKTMPITAENLAAIAEAGGALGIATPDLLEFTRVVALIGTTTNVSTDSAATALGQLQNVIGLTVDDFDNFAAALVQLGNTGASTEASILEITRRAGGSAHDIHIAADATLGWAAAVANLGMQDELAGTALQKFFQQSLRLVARGGKPLAAFAKIAGKSAKDFSKAFKKDASGALEDFIKGLGKLPEDQRILAIDALFGKSSGLSRAISNLASSYDQNLNPALDNARDAWKKNTAATKEAELRYKTTASAFQIFSNNVHDAAITIGAEVVPALKDLSQEGVEWIKQHQPEIKDFAKSLAGAVRGVIGLAKTAVGVGKSIADAWGTIPSEFRDLLVKGLIADRTIKFLFGFSPIGAVIGGIESALAKAVTGGLVSAGLGKLFVQPVFVTNPGFGLPGVPGGGGGPSLPGGPVGPTLLGSLGKGIGIGTVALLPATIAAIGLAVDGAVDPNDSLKAIAIAETAMGRGIADWNNAGIAKLREIATNTGDKTAIEWLQSHGITVTLASESIHSLIAAGGGADRHTTGPLSNVDEGDKEGLRRELGDATAAALRASDIVKTNDVEALRSRLYTGLTGTTDAVSAAQDAISGKIQDDKDAVTAILGLNKGAIDSTRTSVDSAGAAISGTTRGTTVAVNSASSQITGAIRANRPITNVTVNVSATTIKKTVDVITRYGPPGGDRDNDRNQHGATQFG